MSERILTQSSITTLRACPKMYRLRYIDGWYSKTKYDALEIGSSWDETLQIYNLRGDAAAYTYAQSIPDPYLKAKISGMLVSWLKHTAPFRCQGVQISFSCPLNNPLTGRNAREAVVRGKVDGVYYDSDSQNYWIVEYKTSSDITPGYITRLSLDLQVHLYKHFAEKVLGIPVKGVIYDAIKKPTIKLKVNETVEDYEARLRDWYDTNKDTAFYRERLLLQDRDIEEQCWMYHKEILWRLQNDYWPRNSSTCCNFYGKRCGFFEFCDSNDNMMVMQIGFEKREPHQELKHKGV